MRLRRLPVPGRAQVRDDGVGRLRSGRHAVARLGRGWARVDRQLCRPRQSFSPAVTLPATELPLDNGPDARPKIAVGPDHRLVVTFATRDDKYNGHAFITQSTDGGKTFSVPAPIAAGSPSQRFETAAIDADGHAFVAWIDKRNAAAARGGTTAYAGAALPMPGTTVRSARSRMGASHKTTPASAAASPYRSRSRAGRSFCSATSLPAASATTPS